MAKHAKNHALNDSKECGRKDVDENKRQKSLIFTAV
jgi:hypothetical protein